MCDYCEKETVIFQKDILSMAMLQWCFASLKTADDLVTHEYPFGVFIDRGYLRFVDLEDCQCMDHGRKIKINFCPFCGDNL